MYEYALKTFWYSIKRDLMENKTDLHKLSEQTVDCILFSNRQSGCQVFRVVAVSRSTESAASTGRL